MGSEGIDLFELGFLFVKKLLQVLIRIVNLVLGHFVEKLVQFMMGVCEIKSFFRHLKLYIQWCFEREKKMNCNPIIIFLIQA